MFHLGVLRADLREDGDVAGKVGDQLELPVARDLDRAVGDLDVREAKLGQPALELVDLVARVDRLEERAAADDGRLEMAVEQIFFSRLFVTWLVPRELDDVDEGPRGVEEPLKSPAG